MMKIKQNNKHVYMLIVEKKTKKKGEEVNKLY